MKCTFCSYEHKPDSFITLKKHAEEHITKDETRGVIPVVVWRDGEFLLVEHTKDKENTYQIGIVDPRPVLQEDLGFEPLPDEEQKKV